MNQWHITA